jgi:hypothetical protein
MTRLARRALLLVTFSLFGAATAYAECAWILWSKMGGDADEPSGWRRDDAFESRKSCVEKITRIKQQFDSDHLASWRMPSRTLNLTDISETRISYRLGIVLHWDHAQCLPRHHRPARAEGEMNNTDAHLWHPWLCINRVLRVLHDRHGTLAHERDRPCAGEAECARQG